MAILGGISVLGIIALIFFNLFWAWVASQAAQGKGRTTATWAIAGLIFGPFAAMAIAVDRKSPRLIALEQSVELSDMKTCPACRSRVPIAASVCRFCQRDVPTVAVDPGSAVALYPWEKPSSR